MNLPTFSYHPDPLATGMVVPGDATCVCCRSARGYVYVGPTFGPEDIEDELCPWCIADGSAAARFGASFADAHPLVTAGLADAIVAEVTERTPGYVSWQQDQWLVHCDDACAFLGDASVEDIANATADTRRAWETEYGMDAAAWEETTQGYEPGGNPAFYKFACRHCGAVRLGWDCT